MTDLPPESQSASVQSASHSQSHVRGISAYNHSANVSLRIGALVTNFSWIVGIYALLVRFAGFSPLPTPATVGFTLLFSAFFWHFQLGVFGQSLGTRAWKLKRLGTNGARFTGWELVFQCLKFETKLVRPDQLSPALIFRGVLATSASIAVCVALYSSTVLSHPLFKKAEQLVLPPFAPLTSDAERWTIAPFYYALGAWPKFYGQTPVFYSIPYQKGPPANFVGKIHARWSAPEIRLTIEGPKTPPDLLSEAPSENDRTRLRDCFLGPEDKARRCLFMREAALNRHIQEMQSLGPAKHWRLSWFRVNNPSLETAEQPQGIYLSVQRGSQAEERFILIGPTGIHQTLILERPSNESGRQAQILFENLVSGLRVSGNLDSARAWINRQLEQVQLANLESEKDSLRLLERLAEIQSLLISKISVDPKQLDSYFHLGGTSVLMLQHAKKHATELPPQIAREAISAIAKPQALSAHRYAKDVSPKDPRVQQLENFAYEARKF